MHSEEADPQTFYLPFKMKSQEIPSVVGKAMDEWTKEDIAKQEADEDKAIEMNFPSYFDEIQTAFYDSQFEKRVRVDQFESTEVEVEEIFDELLQVTNHTETDYRASYLKDRVKIVLHALDEDETWQQLSDLQKQERTDSPWTEECAAYLSFTMQTQKLKQVMNIAEFELASSFNFYHTPLPSESKLVYKPLVALLMRLRDITIRDEYESPLLNESLFLGNYIL